MSVHKSAEPPPRRPSHEDLEDARPQNLVVREGGLGAYLVRKARQRRERFLRRAETFSLRKELARNVYLAGCLLFDTLIVPEPVYLLPSPWGWSAVAVALTVAVWAEVRLYAAFFSLPGATDKSG